MYSAPAKRRRRTMRTRLLLGGLAITLVVAGCGSEARSRTPSPDPAAITVASVNFSESETLAEIYAQVLERNGYKVRRALDLASREVVEPALEQGVVDLTPEYLGTILAFVDPKA